MDQRENLAVALLAEVRRECMTCLLSRAIRVIRKCTPSAGMLGKLPSIDIFCGVDSGCDRMERPHHDLLDRKGEALMRPVLAAEKLSYWTVLFSGSRMYLRLPSIAPLLAQRVLDSMRATVTRIARLICQAHLHFTHNLNLNSPAPTVFEPRCS